MDYTIIGDSVNLASRLEGVNKNYQTSILISEDTFTMTNNEFVTRRLDRVRVVGIKRPIRLYELIEEKGKLVSSTMELLDIFHEGHDLLEKRDWAAALNHFRKCIAINPEDGPSQHYLKLCEKYMVEEPADTWDGVYVLTAK